MSDLLPITVRRAGPADAAEIARLNRLFNQCDEPAEAYAQRLQAACRVDTPLLAEIGGRCMGTANLRLVPQVFYPEPYAELTELFVEEPYRRRGAARALLAALEDLARAAGAHEVVVRTDFYNHPAQSLYRACGYVHQDIALVKALQPEHNSLVDAAPGT